MKRYPNERLWDELTELAYHLHWNLPDLLDLEHRTRLRLLDTARRLDAPDRDRGAR